MSNPFLKIFCAVQLSEKRVARGKFGSDGYRGWFCFTNTDWFAPGRIFVSLCCDESVNFLFGGFLASWCSSFSNEAGLPFIQGYVYFPALS